MSRFALCSVFVVLCVIQYVAATHDWEAESGLQANTEEETPVTFHAREERSARSRKPSRTLRRLRKKTRVSSSPCECSRDNCTCCARISFNGESDESCSSFRVPDPKTRSQVVRYSFNFNEYTTQTQAPTGRDPKGMCQPFPRYPNSEVCSRYHSTKVENGKIRFCLTMEAKYQGFTFYQMDFDCVTYDIENQQQVGNK